MLVALIAIIIAIVCGLTYMGAFSSVEVQSGSEGGYELAGGGHHGSYGSISETFEDLVAIADANEFDTYNMVSIYFNDPNAVPTDCLRTFVGVVMRDSL